MGGSVGRSDRRHRRRQQSPALINTLAVSLGFGVLMLSQVPANARLGLVNCFVASLLLLPVLLHWWPLKDSRESKTGAPTTDSPP